MTVEFSYRPDNLRLKRTKGTIVNYLIWDGGQIVAELNGTGELTDCYTYGLERIKSKRFNYFIQNGQGDIVHYTNNNGKIMTSYSYDGEYGNVTGGNSNNPFRYRGEYYDTDLKLYYLRARWYDSALGEFISEDPVKDGVNWYVYCSNNPVKFRDPSGLVIEVEEFQGFEPKRENFEDGRIYERLKAVYLWEKRAYNTAKAEYDRAIGYLMQSSDFKALYDKLDGAEEVFTIKFISNHKMEYSSETKTIYWDPKSGAIMKNGTSVQSAALGLAHEMVHAAQYLDSETYAYKTQAQHYKARIQFEEDNLKKYEIPIAIQLGEPTRARYIDGIGVRIMNNSTHFITTRTHSHDF